MTNWFLFLVLTFTLPTTPVAIVTDSPGECAVEASRIGDPPPGIEGPDAIARVGTDDGAAE